MKYHEILDKLEDMHEQSAKEFMGSNEADLDFKEKVARWIEGLYPSPEIKLKPDSSDRGRYLVN